MTAELLLREFERLSEAPGAISKLRRFVLNLAMSGRLTEQRPTDEPASMLLAAIRAHKAFNNAKDRTPVTALGDESDLLRVPPGWESTKLGAIATKITDGTHKTPNYVPAGVPFVSVKDFSGGQLDFSHTRFISPHEHALLVKRCDPRRGDILIGRIGTLGKAVLVDTDREFSLFVSVGLIRFPHEFIAPNFLRMFLNSPSAEQEFDRIKIGGATHTNKLNLGDLHTIRLLLPPLAEQHRIVSKIDELMALCDRLEAAQAERKRRRELVMTRGSSGLKKAVSQPTTDLPTLLHCLIKGLHRATQIGQLRQTAISLAVRGLFDTDRNLEPRRPQAVEDQGLFGLPAGWTWQRFDEVAIIESNLVDPRLYPAAPHIAPDNIERGTGRLLPYDTVRTSGVFSAKHQFFSGCILYSKIRPALSKVVSVDFDGLCSADMYPIRASIERRFLLYYMLSDAFTQQAINEDNRVAMPKINQAALSRILVAVPPPTVQQATALGLDRFMCACDLLERQFETAATVSARFLETALVEALKAA